MLIFDLESNGLLDTISKIHTIVIYDTTTEKYTRYDLEDVEDGVRLLMEADEIAGHNIIFYDIPAIQKVYPWFKPKGKITDTLVLSRLLLADIKDKDMGLFKSGKLSGKLIGSHSLKAWGYRLGVLKGDFGETSDWAEWSQGMSDYCEQDVRVTVKLLEHLTPLIVSEESVELEHEVAKIISRQMQYGFKFDIPKAEKLYLELMEKREELVTKIRESFPYVTLNKGEFTPKRPNKTRGYLAGVTFTKIEVVPTNPSSADHVIYWLKRKYGWKPTVYTGNGNPKLDTDVLEKLDYPEAALIAEYLTVEKRIGQLAEAKQAWLKQVKSDGRLHGSVITNGAVTGRMTHNHPNMAQVPASYSPYGKECRELFTVDGGHKLVGCDASGLELRCLAHYLARYDGGAYAKAVVDGDIHTENQKAAGLPSRDAAKTFIYSWLYGAGDLRIGNSLADAMEIPEVPMTSRQYDTTKKRLLRQAIELRGVPYLKLKKDTYVKAHKKYVFQAIYGAKVKKEFLDKTKGIGDLSDAVKQKAKDVGYLKGLDGRLLRIRSAHSSLNTLLQSAGALVMKKALVILDADLQAAGLVPSKDYEFVGNIHDEWQIEVVEDKAELVGKTAAEAIRKAGEAFKFNCELAGEYKIGNNWSETH